MNFTEIIQCSLIITAIHACMWDGMVFEKLRVFCDKYIHYWIRKPLYDCIICMASVWGTIYYLTRDQIVYSFQTYIEFIFQVAGVNTMIAGIIYLAFIKNTIDIEGNSN